VLPGLAVLAFIAWNYGDNFRTIVLVFAGLSWMYTARIVRAQVVGIQPPQYSWGSLLYDTKQYTDSARYFYLVAFPGFALVLTVLAVSFIGDALRDALDPQR
jgi:ABC-type dipeptide/oligopeptide/nickel transport system permease subunit